MAPQRQLLFWSFLCQECVCNAGAPASPRLWAISQGRWWWGLGVLGEPCLEEGLRGMQLEEFSEQSLSPGGKAGT